ncbi:MAG: hypothetical protein ACJ786_03930 [Catenulispora sp.]
MAHTISMGTTLVRSWENADGTPADTRIDLAFQTTDFLKLRRNYDGMTIRVPLDSEIEAIDREVGGIDDQLRGQPLLVESRGITDFVATMAFAWVEDNGDHFGPGAFAGPVDHDGPPWQLRPLSGLDGGIFATASFEQLSSALTDAGTGPSDGQQYRYVWVLMRRPRVPLRRSRVPLFRSRGVDFGDVKSQPVGVFLTLEQAEDELSRRTAASKHDEWWIDAAPVAV